MKTISWAEALPELPIKELGIEDVFMYDPIAPAFRLGEKLWAVHVNVHGSEIMMIGYVLYDEGRIDFLDPGYANEKFPNHDLFVIRRNIGHHTWEW